MIVADFRERTICPDRERAYSVEPVDGFLDDVCRAVDICGRFLHGAVVGGFCFVVCMGRRHNRPVAVVGTVEGVFQRRGQQ